MMQMEQQCRRDREYEEAHKLSVDGSQTTNSHITWQCLAGIRVLIVVIIPGNGNRCDLIALVVSNGGDVRSHVEGIRVGDLQVRNLNYAVF
jgi:hypothetical protein